MIQPIIRYSILALIAWGTGKGIFKPNSFTDAQISEYANDAFVVLSVVGTIIWSWLEKKKDTIKPVSTVQLPPNINEK